MPLAEPLDAFLADFGVPATIGGRAVTVIFDRTVLSELGIQTENPVITVKHSDMAGVARGDAITVDGMTYRVARIERDPTGGGFDAVELEAA